MELQTFRASTMADAARQVRASLGPNAMILGTRTIQKRQWLGLRRSEIVEITAAPAREAHRSGRAARAAGRPLDAPPVSSGRAVSVGAAAAYAAHASHVLNAVGQGPACAGGNGSAYAAAAREAVRPRTLLETPAAQGVAVVGLQQEMAGLKTLVKELVSQVRHQQSPNVPEDLFGHYLNLIENAVAEEVAAEIIDHIRRAHRPEHLREEEFVREQIRERLAQLVPTAGPIRRVHTDRPHVVALIGPTGVGKTTTIAKLAAELRLRQGHRVGLITIDTYRIAAIEQLKKYSELLRAPLEVVHAPDDMAAALNRLRTCEFVLIDTAGRSPKDTLKLSELRDYLDHAKPDEVHLVVSSTCSESAIDLVTRRFEDVTWDKIIFTKLDEAAQVGVVFNVLRKLNKRLSYVTTGQTVPDDIEVGHGRRLAELVLGSCDATSPRAVDPSPTPSSPKTPAPATMASMASMASMARMATSQPRPNGEQTPVVAGGTA